MNTFNKRSLEQLSTLHPDLILILMEANKSIRIDYDITEGYRSLEKQQEYYRAGKSSVLRGKHNEKPSLAVDLFIQSLQYAYDVRYLCYLAGYLIATADALLKEGKITQRLKWGGNFDLDKVLIDDQKLKDLPHFELVDK